MLRSRTYFSVALVILVLVVTAVAFAFDIAVYFDPRSFTNWVTVDSTICGNRETRIGNIGNEQAFLDTLNSIGVTHLIPCWPFEDDLADMRNQYDLGSLKVLNGGWPMDIFKYLECQDRLILLHSASYDRWDYINDNTLNSSDSVVYSEALGDSALEAHSQTGHTMWYPESPLGIWKGWSPRAGNRSSDWYMPMHFQLECNLDTYNLQDTTAVATLYWYVKRCSARNANWECTERRWTRYPGQTIRVSDFLTGSLVADTLTFVVDPHPDTSQTFQDCEEDFDPIPGEVFHEHHFWTDEETVWGAPVALKIEYHGHNFRFQVGKIHVWDEGFNRLVVDQATYRPTLDSMIASAFRSQLDALPNHMIGWYYDEWNQLPEMYLPWIMVNQILQQANLPRFYLNGHYGWEECGWCPRNRIYKLADSLNVDLPLQMDEMYFLSASQVCRPGTYRLETDSSSDVSYLSDSLCYVDADSNGAYSGHKSLQCAIDEFILGNDGLITHFGILQDPELNLEVVAQVKQVHDAGKKFWAMVASNDDWVGDEDDPGACCSIRIPTPNEVKLSAWLAVACDADGILWYPVALGGGLFDWSPQGADNCGGWLESHEALVVPDSTGRFAAAREANLEIHQIASALEPLAYVKTYASRAYAQNYGTTTNPRDVLMERPLELGDSKVDFIRGYKWRVAQGQMDPSWILEGADSTYVQVSRFEIPGAGNEDYWFLIVNRRALAGTLYGEAKDKRKIEIGISNVTFDTAPYFVEKRLADTREIASAYEGQVDENSGRSFMVELEPGDAELVHFYKADTTDWVITTPTTIEAPAYFARNLVVTGAGKLTIVPNLDALRDSVLSNEQWHYVWDSVATVTFWKGKGITVKSTLANSNALRVLGSDSIRIRLQPAIPADSWKGIYCDMDTGDTLQLKYVDVVGAGIGLSIAAGGTSKYTIDHCLFRENSTALLGQQTSTLGITNTDFNDNGRGLVLNQGVVANLTGGSVSHNAKRCLQTLNQCTVNLSGVVMDGNGTKSGTDIGSGGILTSSSSLRAKCMQVTRNIGKGIDVSGGSVIMSDPQTPFNEPLWGGNRVFGNSGAEIKFTNLTEGFIYHDGLNQTYDSVSVMPPYSPDVDAWIYVRDDDGTWPLLDYRVNYWGGADSATIAARIEPDAPFVPVWTDSEFCNLSPQEGGEECIVEAARKEEAQLYADAKADYKTIIASTSTDCGKKPSIDRILAVDYLGGFSNDSTRTYLKGIADTTNDAALEQAAKMGIAFSWLKSAQNDSAESIYNGILGGNDIYSNPWIDAKAGLVAIEMSETQTDTIDGGLSAETLNSYLDSLEQIFAMRNVWTQYYITDSVVMYAPCRVDSQIVIDEGGSLTILAQPGIKNPVVEFTRAGSIYVDGYPPYTPIRLPRGALYIQGTAETPITLDWTNVTDHWYCDLYSILGKVVMKHAHLIGGSFMNSNDLPYMRRPILQVDSCLFESFEDGMWCWGLNDSSYIRNSTFRQLGLGMGSVGAGVGLLAMETDHLQVENCVFENNPMVGMMFSLVNDANVTNTVITGSGQQGIYQWDGNLTLECVSATDNGDTLPEMWVEGGTVDLVGGHNEFADSTGILIHTTEPSFVDLEEGEDALHLWTEDGLYLKSGDTTASWDITWNNWSPAIPTDPDFYDYLYPHNPNKWTVDSSLADFVACDQGSIESMGPGHWIIVGQDEQQGGIYSHENDQNGLSAFSSEKPFGAEQKSGFRDKRATEITSKQSVATKASSKSRLDAIKQHHEELAKWREFRDGVKSEDKRTAQQIGMQFIDQHPSSNFIPAALAKLATLSDQDDTSVRISTYLAEQSKRLPNEKHRALAKRLSFKAMAKEGRPAEALRGLEQIMETSETPQDSIRALVDAMNVYFSHRNQPSVVARYPFVRNDDVKQLGRRLIDLAKAINDPSLKLSGRGVSVPQEYKLYQNYPNPFNPVTDIQFDLPEAVRVELKVFNILGQEVATLLDAVRPAGAYRVQWDSKSASGQTVASGVYVYQIKAGSFVDAKKMVLIR